MIRQSQVFVCIVIILAVVKLTYHRGVYNRWTRPVDWTGGLEICGKIIRSYSQFVLRIKYMLLYYY